MLNPLQQSELMRQASEEKWRVEAERSYQAGIREGQRRTLPWVAFMAIMSLASLGLLLISLL